MSGPQDGEFPQVEPAAPVSLRPPSADPGASAGPAAGPVPAPAFDTGSDAWWRAQAEAGDPSVDDRPAQVPRAAPYGNWPDPTTDELAVPAAMPPAPPPAAPPGPREVVPPRSPTAGDQTTSSAGAGAGAEAAAPVEVGAGAEAGVALPSIPRLPATPRGRPVPPVAAAPPADASFAPDGPSVPRVRRHEEPAGPRRALAGAALALAGVCLGIGTLLWLDHSRQNGSPAVSLPPAGSTTFASSGPAPGSSPMTATTPDLTAPAVAATSGAAVTTPAAPPPVLVPPTAPTPAARPPLTVLNNSRYGGLARRAAARFRTGGWTTPVVGNFTGRIVATTVYYEPGQLASAQGFARQFGISRVLPRFSGLPGSGLTVVLTRDFA